MKILLINHYAGSPDHGMAYRPFYMAREWIKLGHQVTIVGASYSHLRSKQPKMLSDLTEEHIEGIHYIWLKTPVYQGNGIGRVLNMLSFVSQLFRFSDTILKAGKLDIVIASSTYPLDIYPARFIAKKHKARIVFEVHDLWPLSPMELGNMSSWHPFIIAMQMAENYAYRYCDKVISMLPKAADHMIEHGMAMNKFSYVPNGIVSEEWQENDLVSIDPHQKILDQICNSGQFIVGYTGAHGIANALSSLIEAAELLKNSSFCFVLVGQGPEKEQLQFMVAEKKLHNVVFLPAVPKRAVPGILNRMDVLYIGLQKQSLFRFGVSPNKLMDYMMAAKPVIQAIEAGNDLVAESGCGISVAPEDPAAIAEAIIKLQALSQVERRDMGHKGRDFVFSNHDYRVLAEKFINFIS